MANSFFKTRSRTFTTSFGVMVNKIRTFFVPGTVRIYCYDVRYKRDIWYYVTKLTGEDIRCIRLHRDYLSGPTHMVYFMSLQPFSVSQRYVISDEDGESEYTDVLDSSFYSKNLYDRDFYGLTIGISLRNDPSTIYESNVPDDGEYSNNGNNSTQTWQLVYRYAFGDLAKGD